MTAAIRLKMPHTMTTRPVRDTACFVLVADHPTFGTRIACIDADSVPGKIRFCTFDRRRDADWTAMRLPLRRDALAASGGTPNTEPAERVVAATVDDDGAITIADLGGASAGHAARWSHLDMCRQHGLEALGIAAAT